MQAAPSNQAAIPTAAPAAEGEGANPGAFLAAHKTRLVLTSQPTLTQLLQQLQQQQDDPHLAQQGPGAMLPHFCSSDVPVKAVLSGLRQCPSIAISALRARSSDIGPLAVAAGQSTASLRGYQRVELSELALKQLTSYDFPGNEAELSGLVQRAIMSHPPAAQMASQSSLDGHSCSSNGSHSPSCSSDGGGSVEGCCGMRGCGSEVEAPVLTLDAGDFWAATGGADRARVDVLEVMPWLRKFVLNTGGWKTTRR